MCFLILKTAKQKLQQHDLKEINLQSPTGKHVLKFVNYINENDLNII
tara:strand:+ start:94408 stop:94548 length:141 start_codon:yes stop_codon:yes gene_type:complete